MLGWIRFNASSVTKNAASIALSCPQKRTARRVASKERLWLGNLSAMVIPPFRSRQVARIVHTHDHNGLYHSRHRLTAWSPPISDRGLTICVAGYLGLTMLPKVNCPGLRSAP